MVRPVYKKCDRAISSAEVGLFSNLKLVTLVQFLNKWCLAGKHEDELDESHAIVANKLKHLAFLGPNFLLLWLIVDHHVSGPLVGLRNIAYSLDFNEKWLLNRRSFLVCRQIESRLTEE